MIFFGSKLNILPSGWQVCKHITGIYHYTPYTKDLLKMHVTYAYPNRDRKGATLMSLPCGRGSDMCYKNSPDERHSCRSLAVAARICVIKTLPMSDIHVAPLRSRLGFVDIKTLPIREGSIVRLDRLSLDQSSDSGINKP
jgi:hypothetical protein